MGFLDAAGLARAAAALKGSDYGNYLLRVLEERDQIGLIEFRSNRRGGRGVHVHADMDPCREEFGRAD